ncbi:MAG: hypothetical protein JXR71_03780 [Bacteroidales bacterium]|nr:hypothetical protein [Bacteroidales bacterium]
MSIVLVLVAVVWTDLATHIWKDKNRVIQSDVIEYYGYLPAAFIYHDLSLNFRFQDKGKYTVWATELPNGKAVFKYTMGPALMYAPFFFVANELAGPLGYDTGGYSPPYRLAIILAALFYLLLGLLLLRRVLLLFFTETIAAAVLFSIGLGTNLFWYSTFEPGMPHVYDFFLVSALIFLTFSWYRNATVWKSLVLGVVMGLLTLIRPINILFVLFFVFYRIWRTKDVNRRLHYFMKHYDHILVMLVAGFLVLLPQLIYWKEITGRWLYYSYGKEGFFFLHPHIIDVLFSYRKGWYVYTPVMFFASTGMIFLFRKYKTLAWSVVILAVVYLYVVSSWWSWWYGGSLGQRALIDLYPVMAFPLAALFQWIAQRKTVFRKAIAILIFLSVLLGAFYNVQYYFGAIHWDSMTRKAWFDSFGRLHPTSHFKDFLQTPDYKDALLGKPEQLKPLQKKETFEQVIERIKSDPKWYELIKDKARKRNISVDSMLQLDARYILNRESGK